MATTVTGKITAALSANWSKDLDIGAVAATPQSSVSLTFTNGEGANKVEAVAIKAGTVAGSGSVDIDLAGTLTDPGGDVITFNKIKGFLVKNKSDSGSGFEVGGSFDTWLKASGDEVKVMPGGFLAIGNPTAAGFAVTPTTADTMTLSNLGATDQDYEVIVLGEVA